MLEGWFAALTEKTAAASWTPLGQELSTRNYDLHCLRTPTAQKISLGFGRVLNVTC
jgi:hypothetical protein